MEKLLIQSLIIVAITTNAGAQNISQKDVMQPVTGSKIVPTLNPLVTTPDHLFINTPAFFGEGMNTGNAIHASEFVKNVNSPIALLTTERFPEKQRMILPVKNAKNYSFLITLPIDITECKSSIIENGWKVTINNDGSFFLASNISGDRLGISGLEGSMMPKKELTKTKFIAYQHSSCSHQLIWLFNPESKTFLGRIINSGYVKFIAVPIADALQSKLPAWVDIAWDFTCFTTYTAGQNQPSYPGFKRAVEQLQ